VRVCVCNSSRDGLCNPAVRHTALVLTRMECSSILKAYIAYNSSCEGKARTSRRKSHSIATVCGFVEAGKDEGGQQLSSVHRQERKRRLKDILMSPNEREREREREREHAKVSSS